MFFISLVDVTGEHHWAGCLGKSLASVCSQMANPERVAGGASNTPPRLASDTQQTPSGRAFNTQQTPSGRAFNTQQAQAGPTAMTLELIHCFLLLCQHLIQPNWNFSSWFLQRVSTRRPWSRG